MKDVPTWLKVSSWLVSIVLLFIFQWVEFSSYGDALRIDYPRRSVFVLMLIYLGLNYLVWIALSIVLAFKNKDTCNDELD